MRSKEISEFITSWLHDYCNHAGQDGFIIGISGGIDSAVTSALCAKTGFKTIAISMPIKQNLNQHDLSLKHLDWLKNNFDNVETKIIELDKVFETFENTMQDFSNSLAFANSRSRLRMVTLYQIAQANRGLVVGTGNKVEDFGVGFYTKYGDGGVDISPIADCKKTQVWELGKHLGVSQKIVDAEPTDGLWNDGRNDTDQLGMTYAELEKAMENKQDPNYKRYLEIRKKNLHKMDPIPVCKFNES